MQVIRCLVADDEGPARERLEKMLERAGGVEVVGEADSGPRALELASQLGPHLVFLDYEMPGLTGMEVAHRLSELPAPPHLVFLTAHAEHAVEAFELKALDYLVKPVSTARLATTLERVRLAVSEEARLTTVVGEAIRQLSSAPALLRVALKHRETGDREVVDIDEIECFTSKEERTLARHRIGWFEVSATLARLEAELPADRFLRTHRAFLVHVERVVKVVPWFHGTYNLTLQCGEEVPLSRGYVAPFQQKVRFL